jgi:hypothetical protein
MAVTLNEEAYRWIPTPSTMSLPGEIIFIFIFPLFDIITFSKVGQLGFIS